MRGGHGVVLGVNERVQNLDIEVLSDHWYVLRKATFDYLHRDGTLTREVREAYDRGNGVVIILHDPAAGTVLLTRQFRLPGVRQRPSGRDADRSRRRARSTATTPRRRSAARPRRRAASGSARSSASSSCS